MFEDSTFDSTGRIRTRSRIWGVAAFAFNASILGAMIVIPLIYPEALPGRWMNMLLVAPPPPPTPPKPIEVKPTQAFHGRPELTPLGLTVPTRIPPSIRTFDSAEAPRDGQLITMDTGPTFPSGSPFGHGAGSQPRVVIAPPKGPQRVSQGVADGMLLDRVMPVYPPIARAARVQGTVVLEATITANGTIRNLRVLSGNEMLQQAAIDAVSRWRYRPYLLSGQPVEVETTVSVVFSMGR
ncbi:MAG TPA: TonB family protein [Terracidiphilus sp.]|jgi:protein TonB|nr:TonB family protein [Terracidiphilus sp.]